MSVVWCSFVVESNIFACRAPARGRVSKTPLAWCDSRTACHFPNLGAVVPLLRLGIAGNSTEHRGKLHALVRWV